jgi:hypothetical protein
MIEKASQKPSVRNSAFFLLRHDTCLRNAENAELPQVRDRSLRAAAAWREMYDKAELFEQRHALRAGA